MNPEPTLGRIVLVRAPGLFTGECPAIVVATFEGMSKGCVNVRVFTNDPDNPVLLTSVPPQGESSLPYGWRWPPRAGGDLGGGAGTAAGSGALSQEGGLRTV